jgi:hypothetical protein
MNAWAIGDRIAVTTGKGRVLIRRAMTPVVMGEDFRVVWACSDAEWEAAEAEGRLPDGVPWPADDVQPLSPGSHPDEAYVS